MGGSSSSHTIVDKYKTLEQVREALRREGLESSNLIIAIDFTKSNLDQGRKTFGGRSLHSLDLHGSEIATYNPYQHAIRILGQTLEEFDDDKLIPCFGFGDLSTQDRGVFPFSAQPCYTFHEVLRRYNEVASQVSLSGPTSFAPAIDKAVEIVRQNRGAYHILVIIADGQVTDERPTIEAIVRASEYALSIIVVGVGDGPWELMHKFDDRIPARKFDNFQFVEFHKVMTARVENNEAYFAQMALMEIPEQYQLIKKFGLLNKY